MPGALRGDRRGGPGAGLAGGGRLIRRWSAAFGRLPRIALALLLGLVLCELGLRAAGWLLLADRSGGGGAAGLEVLCIGDSNTYGLFEDASFAYPARLEAILNERLEGGPHRVRNLGLPGLVSSQALTVLEEELAATVPDIVLILIGANNTWNLPRTDGVERTSLPAWRGLRLVRLALLAAQRFDDPPEPSFGVDFHQGLPGVAIAAEVERADRSGATARYGIVRTAGLDDEEEFRAGLWRDLRAMAEAIRERGARPFLLTYASEYTFYGRTNRALREAPGLERVPRIDCGREISPLVDELGPSRLFFPDRHPRASAYELVARLVWNGLVDAGAVAGARIPDPAAGLFERMAPREPVIRFAGRLDAAPGSPDAARIEVEFPAADHAFVVVLSREGEGPGIDWGGHLLDLRDDDLLRATTTRAPLNGVLDENGRGSVELELLNRASPDLFSGPTAVRACFVILGRERLPIRFVSDPVSLTVR